MPFLTLIMGLTAKERLKIPSSLIVVQRDYPIGAHTLTRSTSHIKGSKIGVHTIPRPRVEEDDRSCIELLVVCCVCCISMCSACVWLY